MLIEDKCVNCHKCISVCPVKFCNDASGNLIALNPDLCIGYGECVKACAHQARIGVDDSHEFFEDIKTTPMAAIVTPAIVVSFKGKELELNGWLKSIGIKAVFDVNFGAELTTKSYVEHIKKNNTDCKDPH